MSKSSRRNPPQYRRHKARDCGKVRIFGKDIYFPGKYDSPESWEEYHRFLATYHANGGNLPTPPVIATANGFIGVAVVVEQYLNFAEKYYSKNDPQGKELQCIKYALKPLVTLFGLADATQFGPKSLVLVREHMISLGWCVNVINSRVSRIKRCFKWAVAEEIVPPSVLHGLQAVLGLQAGRSEARVTDPIGTVAVEQVEATLPYLSPVVQAIVRVQLLGGMRPCEVLIMRPCDIDRSGPVWVYTPYKHKNSWRGSKYKRQIALGPKAQLILQPFLDREETAYLFSPREAADLRNAERRKRRKSPMTPSQAKRVPKSSPKRGKREHYDTNSYRRAIAYAIKAANKGKKQAGQPEIAGWYPLQLRHTRATEVRKQYGLEGAQMALGHENASTTEIYAEKSLELAVRIARETG